MASVIIVASLKIGLSVSEESLSEINRSDIFRHDPLYSYQSEYFMFQTKIIENIMFYSQSYELDNYVACLVDLDSQDNDDNYFNFRTKNYIMVEELDSPSAEYHSFYDEEEKDKYQNSYKKKEIVEIPAKSSVRIIQKFPIQGTSSADIDRYDELIVIRILNDEEWGSFDVNKYYYNYCSELNESMYEVVHRIKLVGDIAYNKSTSYNQQSKPKTPDYLVNWTYCSEAKLGTDFFVKDSIIIYDEDKERNMSLTDYCAESSNGYIDRNFLIEYYCKSDSIMSTNSSFYSSKIVECDCNQGKCTQGTIINSSIQERKISFWCGKVNQYMENGKNWASDIDGVSDCMSINEYCEKLWPDTKYIISAGEETITNWQYMTNYTHFINGGWSGIMTENNTDIYTSQQHTFACLP